MAAVQASAPSAPVFTVENEALQQGAAGKDQPPAYSATQYPPAQAGYPPAQAAYPPPQAGYPPTAQYSQQYPPPQYPPAQSQYPPPPQQYPPTQNQYWAQTAGQPKPNNQRRRSSASSADRNETTFTQFSEKSIRLAFVRKVFAILGVMLLVTAGIMCIFMFVEEVKEYVQENNWVYITSICVYFVAIFTLVCVGELRRKTPQNFIFLGIITVAMGVMLGTIATYFETREILIAVGIVVIITIGMCALGFQNKIDFTVLYGVLFVGLLSLIGFGLMAAIFQSEILYIFYASLGAFLFSIYIVVDVQMMMGGKHKFAISPEEYVVAALNLYLDIVNLLLYILMIIKGTS